MAADSQKLIAYGKVLEDDNKTLKDYSIKENDFLVVMVAKVITINTHDVDSPSQFLSQRKMRRWRSPFKQLRLSHHSQHHSLYLNQLRPNQPNLSQLKSSQLEQVVLLPLSWKQQPTTW